MIKQYDARSPQSGLVFVTGLFRSRAALQAEIFILRHQLNVLHRKSPKRLVFSNIHRLIFAGVYALMPSVRNALKILKPETVIAWHRAGFRASWRRKPRADDIGAILANRAKLHDRKDLLRFDKLTLSH